MDTASNHSSRGAAVSSQESAMDPAGVSAREPVLILRDHYRAEDGSLIRIDITDEEITLHQGDETDSIPLDEADAYQAMLEEVRYHIARKIAMLAPTLAEEKLSYLLEYTLKVLRVLAEDQAARVRRIIAEELKDAQHAPADIIRRLAWDDEREVAEPVLEYSPLLSDADLLDIIASSQLPWVTEAISKRRKLNPQVSEAIILGEQEDAITNLLENEQITLSEQGLDEIVRMAPYHDHWHLPLVCRHELTNNTINRIAEFISHTIFRRLEDEGGTPPRHLSELKLAVHKRLQEPQWDRKRSAEVLAEDLYYRNKLDGARVLQAIEEHEEEFVLFALSHLAECSYDKVRKIISSDNPRAVTSLCWKAGLAVRDAIKIQMKVAKIPHTSVLYAKNGVEYSLTEAQMQEYFDFFS